jgi:hypothetical protein
VDVVRDEARVVVNRAALLSVVAFADVTFAAEYADLFRLESKQKQKRNKSQSIN